VINFRPVLPAPGESEFRLLEKTLFFNASLDLAQQHQVPEDMAALTLLGTLPIVCQGRYDLELPNGSLTPLSLNTLIVVDSGEGKTAIKKKTLAPIMRLQASRFRRHQEDLADHMLNHSAWELEKSTLKAALRKTELKGEPTHEAWRGYKAHLNNEPPHPREFRLLYKDTTPEGLFLGLRDILPTAGLITDEGDIFFRSSMNRAKGHLNSLWDGDDIIVTRASKEDIVIYGARFSIQIGIQPGVLTRHLKPEDRDSGWLARFLVCAPQPKRGSRHYTLNNAVSGSFWQEADQRLEDMAKDNLPLLEDKDLPRHILQFSRQAKNKWVQLANEIEKEMRPGHRFQACPDHASKLSNQIGRVAALLHLFEREEGDISERTLSMAVHLCSYYSTHFQQTLMPPPQEVQDAMLLQRWLNEQRQFGYQWVEYNRVRQRGPNPLRNKKRLQEAIDVLCFENLISLSMHNQTRVIYLNPPQPSNEPQSI
jgi:hypothetical protein